MHKKATVERPDIPPISSGSSPWQCRTEGWCGDITYIRTLGRWSYLVVVFDLSSRRVVGLAMSVKSDADLVIKALNRAYEMRGRPNDWRT